MKKKAKTLSKFYTVGYRRPPKKFSSRRDKVAIPRASARGQRIHLTSRRSLKATPLSVI